MKIKHFSKTNQTVSSLLFLTGNYCLYQLHSTSSSTSKAGSNKKKNCPFTDSDRGNFSELQIPISLWLFKKPSYPHSYGENCRFRQGLVRTYQNIPSIGGVRIKNGTSHCTSHFKATPICSYSVSRSYACGAITRLRSPNRTVPSCSLSSFSSPC